MAPRQHLLDDIASEVGEWIESMSTDVVNALTEGGIAPFAANVDDKEKLSYFSSQVYLPDGSINVDGRNKLMQQYGPDGYAAIMRTVLKSMGGMPPIPTSAFAAPTSKGPPGTIPTEVPGVSQIPDSATPPPPSSSGALPPVPASASAPTIPTGVPGVSQVVGS
jgi:hypothetical protein